MPYVGGTFGEPYGIIFGDYLGFVGVQSTAGGTFHVSEIGFYSGGAGGTRENAGLIAVHQDVFDIGTETDLTDGDITDQVLQISNLQMEANNRAYIGWDFGAPRPDINAIRFAAAGTDPARTPKVVSIAQSADGQNWSYVATSISCSEPAAIFQWGGYGTFSMIYSDPGPHSWWRIAEIDNVDVAAGNSQLWVSEIRIYVGSTNVTSQATKTTTCTFLSGSMADWFDNDATTAPIVEFANIGTITFEFPSAKRVNGLGFGGSSGSNPHQKYIHRCSLQWSDNGTDWNHAGRIAALTYPGNSTFGNIVRLY